MWTASDEALLAGLATGDPDAAAAFVRRFQRRVFGLAMVVVGDRAVAEEVAQEALVRAWRHGGVFDPRRGSVATWLLTITRNLAIDAVRGNRTVPADPGALLAMHLSDPGRAPDEAAAVTIEVARLRLALADLPEEQRRALVLARFGGRTASEVAAIEGIPLGTAKTRIRSALLRLRSVLEETTP